MVPAFLFLKLDGFIGTGFAHPIKLINIINVPNKSGALMGQL